MKIKVLLVGVAGSVLLLFLLCFVAANAMQHWVAFRKPQVQREWKTERRAELEMTMRQAQPIIHAVKTYIKEHKSPPDSLQSLIPKYLKSIPKPGTAARNGWQLGPKGQTWGGEVEQSLSGGWWLGIHPRSGFCPKHPGIMSLGDYFVYHPSGKYPKNGYCGVLERIGDWAYYHE